MSGDELQRCLPRNQRSFRAQRLGSSGNLASLGESQARYDALQARIARLELEIEGLFDAEFVCPEQTRRACQRGVELDISRPGKPTDNALVEPFNGKFRSECLNAHRFLTLDDARSKIEEWRKDYTTVRPHGAIGSKPPISLM